MEIKVSLDSPTVEHKLDRLLALVEGEIAHKLDLLKQTMEKFMVDSKAQYAQLTNAVAALETEDQQILAFVSNELGKNADLQQQLTNALNSITDLQGQLNAALGNEAPDISDLLGRLSAQTSALANALPPPAPTPVPDPAPVTTDPNPPVNQPVATKPIIQGVTNGTASGTADPSASVTVTSDTGGLSIQATADENGNWTANFPALPTGTYAVTATVNSVASDPFTLVVP